MRRAFRALGQRNSDLVIANNRHNILRDINDAEENDMNTGNKINRNDKDNSKEKIIKEINNMKEMHYAELITIDAMKIVIK